MLEIIEFVTCARCQIIPLTKSETECKLKKASVGRQPSADGCSVSNGHFFGRRAEKIYGAMVTPCSVTCENKDEKTAPPIIAQLQKGHCMIK